MKKPLINLVASTDQNFTEEELRQLWENLQLSRFFREAEIDPIRNVSATDLDYNEEIDLDYDTLTWDVEGEHKQEVNYYKIKCKNMATSVTTVYETEEGQPDVREFVISPFLRPGTYKISVYPEGEIAAGSPDIITVTILPMEDKVNGFEVTYSRVTGTTDADANYTFSTNKVSGDFAALNEITHASEFGYEVTNPDGTTTTFASANDVPSFILDKNVGTYSVRAYAKNDYELAYTEPVNINGTFNNSMHLFNIDSTRYNQRDTMTVTPNTKKMAEYISGYYILENDVVKLTSYSNTIDLSNLDIGYGEHDCKIEAFDKLDYRSQRKSFTATRTPYLDEIEMNFVPTDYYQHEQQYIDDMIYFKNGDSTIDTGNMRGDVEIQIDECATEPVIISAFGPSQALALAEEYKIEVSGTNGFTLQDSLNPSDVQNGQYYSSRLAYDPNSYEGRTDIIDCTLSATPISGTDEGLTFITEVKAAPDFTEKLPLPINFYVNNIEFSCYTFGDCTMHYSIDGGTEITKSSGFNVDIETLDEGEHYITAYWTKIYNESDIVKTHEILLTFKVYSIKDIQPSGYVDNNNFYFGVSATSPEFATPKANSYKYYYETPDDRIYSGYEDYNWNNNDGSITAATSTSAGTYDITVWPANISAVGDTIYELDIGLPVSGTLEAIVQ